MSWRKKRHKKSRKTQVFTNLRWYGGRCLTIILKVDIYIAPLPKRRKDANRLLRLTHIRNWLFFIKGRRRIRNFFIKVINLVSLNTKASPVRRPEKKEVKLTNKFISVNKTLLIWKHLNQSLIVNILVPNRLWSYGTGMTHFYQTLTFLCLLQIGSWSDHNYP